MRPLIKTILSLLLGAVLLGSLTVSCVKRKTLSPLAEWMGDNGKVKVLSTIAQIGDLTVAVGGDKIDSFILVPGDLDPHSYELVKGDEEKLSRADLIFYNGLGLEHGAGLSALLTSSPKAYALGDAVRRAAPEKILQKNGVVDPHVWMDVSLWKHSVREIEKDLSRIDPANAPYYRERAIALEKEMDGVHGYVKERLMSVPSEKRYLVTSHDAFRYFAREYLAEKGEEQWQNRFTSPEGLAPDGQMSPVDIKRSIDFLKAHQIHVLFPESNISRDAVAKIASVGLELGLEIRLCPHPLYGDSTSGLTYFEMMRANADVVSEELNQ